MLYHEYPGIVLVFNSRARLFDYTVDWGNLMRAWLGGTKSRMWFKDGGIKTMADLGKAD